MGPCVTRGCSRRLPHVAGLRLARGPAKRVHVSRRPPSRWLAGRPIGPKLGAERGVAYLPRETCGEHRPAPPAAPSSLLAGPGAVSRPGDPGRSVINGSPTGSGEPVRASRPGGRPRRRGHDACVAQRAALRPLERSGGRTRTPNYRARTCRVADYTTPEWGGVIVTGAALLARPAKYRPRPALRGGAS